MIDWFTVSAQVVNFLILIAILRYFLYGRIMKLIDDRRQSIEHQRAEAERLRAELQKELARARRANEELDQQRDAMLQAIKAEVATFRQQQEQIARQETEALRARWLENLEHQRESFLHALKLRIVETTERIARKALQDLADVSLESRLVDRLMGELEHLDPHVRQEIALRRNETSGPVIVESRFPLSDQQQRWMESRLRKLFGNIDEIRFDTSDDLDCGVSVQINSHTLGWNLRDYLEDMESEMRGVIDQELRAAPSETAAAPGGES